MVYETRSVYQCIQAENSLAWQILKRVFDTYRGGGGGGGELESKLKPEKAYRVTILLWNILSWK